MILTLMFLLLITFTALVTTVYQPHNNNLLTYLKKQSRRKCDSHAFLVFRYI